MDVKLIRYVFNVNNDFAIGLHANFLFRYRFVYVKSFLDLIPCF